MILHIVSRNEWNEALRIGEYAPPSLTSEGFVHCSTASQIERTAGRFFKGQDNLVLLHIDEQRLTAPLRYEAPISEPAALFPHVYGPINLDAVIDVIDYRRPSA